MLIELEYFLMILYMLVHISLIITKFKYLKIESIFNKKIKWKQLNKLGKKIFFSFYSGLHISLQSITLINKNYRIYQQIQK